MAGVPDSAARAGSATATPLGEAAGPGSMAAAGAIEREPVPLGEDPGPARGGAGRPDGGGGELGKSLVLLAVTYVTLALYFAGFGALWSPDSGARLAMVRGWVEHGSLVYLPYPLADVDPGGRLHGLAWYVFRLPRGLCTIYSPLFPLLSAWFYRRLGFAGLAALPVLGGLGTVAATRATAARLKLRAGPGLTLALGLATPLVLYSAVFWDHTLHMLLVAAAGYCLLRALETGRAGWAFASGALLGAGVRFQELFLVLFAALLASAGTRWRRAGDRAVLLALGAGFAIPAAAWMAANGLIYGAPGGPHTLGPNRLLDAEHLHRMLSPAGFARRAASQLLGDPGPGPAAAGLGAVLAAYLLSANRGGRARLLAPLLGIAAACLALAGLLRDPWAHGLFEATPLLIPALAPPFRRPAGEAEPGPAPELLGWMYRACALFGGAVLLNPITPGLEWGSRYLLTVLPWLLLLAVAGLERQYREGDRAARWLTVCFAVAIGVVSIAAQCRGFLAIRGDLEQSRRLIASVEAAREPVLVSDLWWLGAELTPSRVPKVHLLLRDDEEDRGLLLTALERLGAREVAYYGTREGLAALQRSAVRRRQPFTVTGAREENGWQAASLRR